LFTPANPRPRNYLVRLDGGGERDCYSPNLKRESVVSNNQLDPTRSQSLEFVLVSVRMKIPPQPGGISVRVTAGSSSRQHGSPWVTLRVVAQAPRWGKSCKYPRSFWRQESRLAAVRACCVRSEEETRARPKSAAEAWHTPQDRLWPRVGQRRAETRGAWVCAQQLASGAARVCCIQKA